MGWSNARTRALLKGLRHPHVLRSESVIAVLRRRYGVDDDREALVRAVDAALANDPALRAIVYRCDLQGEDTRGVADSLHFSERQFHRYRSFAIEAIAAEIDRATAVDDEAGSEQQLLAALAAVDPERAHALLQQARPVTQAQRLTALRVRVEIGDLPADDDLRDFDDEHRLHAQVLCALGLEHAGEPQEAERLVAELRQALRAPDRLEDRRAAFELAALRRLQGRRRGRMDECAAAVGDMNPEPSDVSRSVRAQIARAQLAIHDAAVTDWRERLAAAGRAVRNSPDVRLLRYLTMVEGYLGYVHGDPELALRHSRIATMSGANPATALQSEALCARATLALRQPWERPAWTRGVLPKVWFQAELDLIGAFHALRAGDGAEARRLATKAREHPGAPFAPSIGVYAAAVFAALEGGVAPTADDPALPDLLVETDLRIVFAAA